MNDAEYEAARREIALAHICLRLFVELVVLVAVVFLGALAAIYALSYDVSLWAIDWSGFTGIVAGCGFLFGCSWHRIKDWLF